MLNQAQRCKSFIYFDLTTSYLLLMISRELSIKGAPDILLSRCHTALQSDGSIAPLSDTDRETIERAKDEWSTEGKRVVLVARKGVTQAIRNSLKTAQAEKSVTDFAMSGLTFVGMWALIDPLVRHITKAL